MANSKISIDTISTKPVLTFKEACTYTGFSASYLYKLTAERRIPHSKPSGKMVFFDRAELEAWLMGNRVATAAEIGDRAKAYCQKGGVQ